MALIIEDGTGKTDAESYATVAEAQAWATKYGLTLPSTEAAIEVLLRKAADYLNTFEPCFCGERTYEAQRLSWPRQWCYRTNGHSIDSNEVPLEVKEAQMQLAVEANSQELNPNGLGQETVEETIGPITLKYATGGGLTIRPQFNVVNGLLKPLFRSYRYTTRA